MSALPYRFTGIMDGIYLHRGRIGIVHKPASTYVFTSFDPDGMMMVETSLESPKLLGRSWPTALLMLKEDAFTEEKWKEDYAGFVAMVQEAIEDRLLDDRENSSLVEFDEEEEEEVIRWMTEEVEDLVHNVTKSLLPELIWYRDDNCLDRALTFSRSIPNTLYSEARSWTDFKRLTLMYQLQKDVYQSILDREE